MLLQNLRARIGARLKGDSEAGFTLIELLVVMLILGILAAIALPAFFNQQDKAGDAEAKSIARTAQTAMETYATDTDGSYAGADYDALVAIEETLSDIPEEDLDVAVVEAGDSYEVTVTSSTDNTFSIQRTNTGALNYECTEGGEGGCPTGGDWD